MFDKILIRPSYYFGEPQLDIRCLVDTMLYYDEVHVISSQFEIKQLCSVFGEETLIELINSKRLLLHPCDQHFGTGIHEESYSIGLYSHNFQDIHELLYKWHSTFNDDKSSDKSFADKFAPLLSIYKHPTTINDSLQKDFEDEQFMTNAARAYISKYFPEYQGTAEIVLKCEPVTHYNDFYSIISNLNIPQLDLILKSRGERYRFNVAGLLLSVGETNVDCYSAASFDCELLADSRYSELYKVRMNKCINNALGSSQTMNNFTDAFAYGFVSLGEAFTNGTISPTDLVEMLNDDDSIKFRNWTSKLPANTSLAGEFYNECESRLSNKPAAKITRFAVSSAIGAIPVVGPIAGLVVSGVDQFVGDRIIDGWKPKLFLDKILRNEQLRESQE